jgi:hypothetical protein
MGKRIIHDLGLSINGKVEAIISGVEWNWPAAQSAERLELRRATPMKTKKHGLTKMQKDHLRYAP